MKRFLTVSFLLVSASSVFAQERFANRLTQQGSNPLVFKKVNLSKIKDYSSSIADFKSSSVESVINRSNDVKPFSGYEFLTAANFKTSTYLFSLNPEKAILAENIPKSGKIWNSVIVLEGYDRMPVFKSEGEDEISKDLSK